jgi:hypothetical protein
MVLALRAQAQNVYFLKPGFTGSMDVTVSSVFSTKQWSNEQ